MAGKVTLIINGEGRQKMPDITTDIPKVTEKVRYEVAKKALKLDYNFLLESLIYEKDMSMSGFEKTNEIFADIDFKVFADYQSDSELNANAKALATILYSELTRLALDYTRITGRNADSHLAQCKEQLNGMCIKSLRILK